ncbi:hypothetical protein OAA53_03045 [Salibacteraceae bacterium]|nr:hypothetical protein [Salibacteraceae bacterium]
MIIYEKLFEVKIFHAYYNAYSVSDFEFVLPASTHRFLSMYSLLFKPTAEGFVILYKREKASLIQNLKASIQFTFYLKIKNRNIGNFTLLDYALSAEKYYFSNTDSMERVDSKSSEKKSMLLHPLEFVNSADVITSIQPNSTLSKALGGSNLAIEKNGEEIFRDSVADSATAAEVLGSAYGVYTYSSEERIESSRLYYSPPTAPEVFGVIDLNVGNQEKIQFDDVRNQVYEVRFSNRPVHWTYYFISNAGHAIEQIEIASGKVPLSFSKPQQVTLVNGKKATCVTSEEALPLKSSYNGDKLFATISISSSEISEKRIRLPQPDVKRIKGSNSDGTQKYFSEMYVYV